MGFNSSYSSVQPYFFQKEQNIIHVDVLKQVIHTIYLEELLSDDSESSTFYENGFNGARPLTCQILVVVLVSV